MDISSSLDAALKLVPAPIAVGYVIASEVAAVIVNNTNTPGAKAPKWLRVSYKVIEFMAGIRSKKAKQ